MFAQNIHEKSYPASITKIMTAILAFKNGNMDDIVTIPAEALNQESGSTEIGFQEGDQVTLDELLHGLLIYSGNDAAVAIAQHIGGSVDQFVEMMNQEALELGATNTHFANPSGLQDENHYTTVYDIYLMLQEAMTYPHFLEIAQLSSYNLTCNRGEQEVTFHLDATDQYLTRQVTAPKNVTVLGGKTGTTSDAGSCLALLSQNAYGEPYISIVLHAANKTNLYTVYESVAFCDQSVESADFQKYQKQERNAPGVVRLFPVFFEIFQIFSNLPLYFLVKYSIITTTEQYFLVIYTRNQRRKLLWFN